MSTTDLGAATSVAAPSAGVAPAVATLGLTKRFPGGQVAVNGIDLHVPTGAVYGFLGPNGSGKTTTIRMLLGLVAPTGGSVALLGEPMPRAAASVLPRVGALVEGPAFHPYLSGHDNLRRADDADRSTDPRTAEARIGTALERVGLTAAAGKRYRAYSLGMRQRLGLAVALLRPRELMVLDEPTNGLDPQGTREVRHLVHQLAADGTTVVVSSHLLSEVEQMCTHVGVMSAGQLVAQGPLEQVRGASTTRVQADVADVEVAKRVLTGLGLTAVAPTPSGLVADLGDAVPEEVLAALVAAGAGVRQYVLHRPTLEDLFVTLTGEGFDVER